MADKTNATEAENAAIDKMLGVERTKRDKGKLAPQPLDSGGQPQPPPPPPHQ